MKPSAKITIVGIVALAVIIVLGITSALIPHDDSHPSGEEFMSWQGCAKPCWRGIKPGSSRSNDVLRALMFDNAIQSAGIHLLAGEPWEGNTEGVYLISWIEPRNGASDSVVMRKDFVELVRISNYSRLTLGDIVQTFGPPDYMLAYNTAVGPIQTRFVGYWPGKGIAIDADVPYSRTFKLDPLSSVTFLSYFEPTSVDRMWQIPYMEPYGNTRCTLANWQSWPGWVEVTTLPPPSCR